MADNQKPAANATFVERLKRHWVATFVAFAFAIFLGLGQFISVLKTLGFLCDKTPVRLIADCYERWQSCRGLSSAECRDKLVYFPGSNQCKTGCS
jgi:hypothetical protein